MTTPKQTITEATAIKKIIDGATEFAMNREYTCRVATLVLEAKPNHVSVLLLFSMNERQISPSEPNLLDMVETWLSDYIDPDDTLMNAGQLNYSRVELYNGAVQTICTIELY